MTSHSSSEIRNMAHALRADVEASPDVQFPQNVWHHLPRHRELCTHYPMLYRTICKGTFRQNVLDTLLTSRDAIRDGTWTRQEALDYTIKEAVDDVRQIRDNLSGTPHHGKK